MWILKNLLLNEAGAADGGGSGAAPAPAPAPAPSQAPSAVEGSVLSAAAQPLAINELIPEKYRVNGDDGNFNLEGSARKLADAYSHLEKRLGAGDTPPKTAEEYSLDGGLPDGFDAAEVMKDPTTQSFLKRCHAKGLTNAQVQDVMNFALSEWAPRLIGDTADLNRQEAIESLRQVDGWQSDEQFQANTKAAFRAFQAFADPSDKDSIDAIGNNPIVLRLLANIGKEMGEDRSVSTAQPMLAASESEITALMQSEAYQNSRHPDYAATSARVKAFFDRKYGSSPVM